MCVCLVLTIGYRIVRSVEPNRFVSSILHKTQIAFLLAYGITGVYVGGEKTIDSFFSQWVFEKETCNKGLNVKLM